MDYNKIGKFITTERKAKKLTQAKLAEKIFVSEKTVSKWENGKGIPDTSVLPKLCEVLQITINELLNGERLSTNDTQNNEQLLLKMAKELEIKNKIIWKSMWIIILVSIISMCTSLFLVAFLMPEGIWQLVVIFAICVIFLTPCFFALKLEISVGVYKCKKCGCEIIPTYNEALWAMHRGTTRYFKCPNCKKHTWCKKNINK